MNEFIKALFSAWSWRMAYRDSRAAKWKMLLFSASIVFGVASLVTIGSLRHNLNDAVKSQAKSLLGADIQLSGRQVFSDKANRVAQDLGGQQVREISFTTMLTVGNNPQPSMVNVRGVESGFPFYGSIAATPSDSWAKVQSGMGVIVEQSFLLKMQGKVGDPVKLGDLELTIVGTLDEAPPGSSGFAGITPTLITALENVKGSNLLEGKSLSFHKTYIKLSGVGDSDAVLEPYKEALETERLSATTAKRRGENIEKGINNLYLFLNLIGFSSLFLGGIGIAGAIHIHITERLKSVATLRCLGCTSPRAFAIYFIQGIAMGACGTLLGLGVGCFMVMGIDQVAERFSDAIPFAIEIGPVVSEVAKSALVGFAICICFALLPLLKVRRVSPLAALRQGSQADVESGRDPVRWLIILAMMGIAFLLAWYDNQQMARGLATALGYVVFLVVAFGMLLGSGLLLRWVLKLLVRPIWPLTFRQGFSALYRPNNQTSIFMLSIGLGVFFLFTLVLTQNVLLQWLSPERLNGRPNMFLVDVPPEEAEQAKKLIASTGVEPLKDAPIIQLRLLKIKDTPVNEIIAAQAKAEKEGVKLENRVPKWILRRSFRSTYRTELSETEWLSSGTWVGSYSAEDKVIPISIEKDIAADLGVKLGDTITMEVEGFGESFELKIASMREVDWRSMNLNFFIVLPDGPIKDYVAFNILTANSPSPETTANLQQEMFKQWPTVNVIDLSLLLKTAQSILSACGQAIQVMALFTLVTGSIVLVSSLLSGRRVRVKETTLLRTLGASQGQIAKILAIEYSLLAVLATVSGAVLSVLACVLLGWTVFDGEPYDFPWHLLLIGSAIVIVVTVSLGMLLSRGIAKVPPMQSIKES